MNPRLVAISGPLEGRTFELRTDPFTIGRQDGNDLCVPGLEVSRRHCELRHGEGDRFTLRDLDSSHGTFVNGRPIRARELEHSDLVSVGASNLLFLIDDTSPGVDPRPAGPEPSAERRTRKLSDVLLLDPARVDAALPENARLARELHTLLRLSEKLQEALDIGTLAERLLDAAFEAVPAQAGAVFLREPGVDTPITLAERGTVRPSRTVVAQVLDDGLAVFSPRLADDTELSAVESVAAAGALLVAPLTGEDSESLGALYLERAASGFGERHLDLVTALAGVASLALRNALHLRWLRSENRRLRDERGENREMIGESAAMRHLSELVTKVARADSTVLVHGESGTGKELVVRAIHRASPRRDGPLVAVNCASLSETLLESELFGHERGAFTGAVDRKTGKMEAAHRGTLFLDEVAEIPVAVQAKLLRALQERVIERVGGTRPIPVDVRLVAASHRDLEQAVRDGDFREDLYYRLKVITCTVPPLRERRDDIPLLASHFARVHGQKLGLASVGIAPSARQCLLAYDWPGNVRELANVIERAVVLGDGEVIYPEDLPEDLAGHAAEDAGDFQATLAAFKKQLILDAWRRSGSNYATTAEALGLHVNSLHRLVRNLGLKDELAELKGRV